MTMQDRDDTQAQVAELLRLAQALAESRNPGRAMRPLVQALRLDPTNAQALVRLAAMEHKAGRTEAASDILALALAHHPYERQVVLTSADVLKAQGLVDEARAVYLNYVLSKPDDEEALRLLLELVQP